MSQGDCEADAQLEAQCCVDSIAFVQKVQNGLSFDFDNVNCKATVSRFGIAACYQVGTIEWGDGNMGQNTGQSKLAISQLSGSHYRDFGIDDICFRKIAATASGPAL